MKAGMKSKLLRYVVVGCLLMVSEVVYGGGELKLINNTNYKVYISNVSIVYPGISRTDDATPLNEVSRDNPLVKGSVTASWSNWAFGEEEGVAPRFTFWIFYEGSWREYKWATNNGWLEKAPEEVRVTVELGKMERRPSAGTVYSEGVDKTFSEGALKSFFKMFHSGYYYYYYYPSVTITVDPLVNINVD